MKNKIILMLLITSIILLLGYILIINKIIFLDYDYKISLKYNNSIYEEVAIKLKDKLKENNIKAVINKDNCKYDIYFIDDYKNLPKVNDTTKLNMLHLINFGNIVDFGAGGNFADLYEFDVILTEDTNTYKHLEAVNARVAQIPKISASTNVNNINIYIEHLIEIIEVMNLKTKTVEKN